MGPFVDYEAFQILLYQGVFCVVYVANFLGGSEMYLGHLHTHVAYDSSQIRGRVIWENWLFSCYLIFAIQ